MSNKEIRVQELADQIVVAYTDGQSYEDALINVGIEPSDLLEGILHQHFCEKWEALDYEEYDSGTEGDMACDQIALEVAEEILENI